MHLTSGHDDGAVPARRVLITTAMLQAFYIHPSRVDLITSAPNIGEVSIMASPWPSEYLLGPVPSTLLDVQAKWGLCCLGASYPLVGWQAV